MFGAVRNEPDAFTEAFFNELRARPDLFQGLTRSETDPGRHVETFGAHEGEDILPWQTRLRSFEAPRASFQRRPQGQGTWKVEFSAMDLLYSTTKVHGYLADPRPDGTRWFFSFKKPEISVKYFIILDAIPTRPHSVLSRNVAWAALRAKGFASGEYSLRKYARASDALFEKCMHERMSWAPMSWRTMKKMEDEI